jgi:hypothetical protein
MMQRIVLTALLLVLFAGVTLAQVNEQPLSEENTGNVRVINALVGIGPVDVYVNERVIGASLPPRTATPYLALAPGQYVITVRFAGDDALGIPIADLLLDLPPGASKSALVYQQRYAPPGAAASSQLEVAQSGSIMLLDDNRSPLPVGKSRLTAVHVAHGNPQNLSIAYPSRASLLHEIALGQPYGDIDIDAGAYSLTIVDATSPNLDRLAFIGEQVFISGVHYTLVIVPDLQRNPTSGQIPLVPALSDNPRLFVISAPIEPPANGIQLRIIHAAPDTAVLDVYVDERLVAPRLNFSQYTPYLGLNTYSHVIDLRRRDAPPDSAPLATAQFTITEENESQRHWSLLLLNPNDQLAVAAMEVDVPPSPNNVSLQPGEIRQVFETSGGPISLVLVPDNIAQTGRGSARVRLLHAIDGALEISLYVEGVPQIGPTATPRSGPTPTPEPPRRVINPVIYGAEANENELPAGVYGKLDFIAGNSTEILSLDNWQLLPGMVHTFVMIGQPSGEPAIEALELTDFGRGLPQERLYIGVIQIVDQGTTVANVRLLPSTAARVLDQLATGTEVEVLGRNFDGTWLNIRYTVPTISIPQDGWIFQPLVKVTRLGDPINPLALPER